MAQPFFVFPLNFAAPRIVVKFGISSYSPRLEFALLSSPWLDYLLDLALDRLRCQVVAIGSRDARVEEELQLEDSLRGVDVLIGGHARNGRFVHSDVLGDVA